MSEAVQVDGKNFDEVVLKSKTPVIVDFWAPWCMPCRMIAPHLDAIAKEMGDKLVVAKLNTDENPELSVRYQVSGIPTLMIFKNGEMVDRIVGGVPKEFIKEKVSAHLS